MKGILGKILSPPSVEIVKPDSVTSKTDYTGIIALSAVLVALVVLIVLISKK